MSDSTQRLRLPELVSMQEANCVTWNEALIQLDAFIDLYLLGQYVNTPPASPADGDAYLTGGSPTGAWSGYAYKIASCIDGGWRFYIPFNGLRAFVATSNTVIVYANGTWTALGSTDFATKSGTETLSNKTLGATNLPGGAIDGSGRLGLGTVSPSTVLNVACNSGSALGYGDGIQIKFGDNSANDRPVVGFYRSRGSSSSPSAVSANDVLGSFSFFAYTGSWIPAGTVRFDAETSAGYGRMTVFTTGSDGEQVRLTMSSAGVLEPGADNTQNFGGASKRWATIYAGTGTINTSGAGTKTNVRVLSAAEIAVAKALAANVRVFRFCGAVARKGEAARLHTGTIYEDVVAAFTAQGLDPERYGILCRDPAMKTVTKTRTVQRGGKTVEETYGETEPDLDEAGAPKWVLGLRYSELAQFVMAGLAARLAALEAE